MINTSHHPVTALPLFTCILMILIMTIISCSPSSMVKCDFTYGYENNDDYNMAIINITYIDPVTGELHSEQQEFGRFQLSRGGSVSGVLVLVRNAKNKEMRDACEPIDTEIFPSEPWVAMVQSGTCNDRMKLKHIANTNASAAVIYSSNKNEAPKSKFPTTKSFNLMVVSISKEKGELLAALIDNGTRVIVGITMTSHSSLRYANINRTSVLFVSISFIVLMIISLAWLIFYYVQRFRYIHAKDLLARRLSNAAKKAMEKIPTKTLRPADLESISHGELAECCAVCIEPFKTSDIVRILPCKHLFHKSCVDPWLLDNRSCPMCKMDILKFYGLVCANSQESVLNIEDIEMSQNYWNHHRRYHRSGSDDVEIVHIPIPLPSPMSRNHYNSRRPSNNGQQSRQSIQNNNNSSTNSISSSLETHQTQPSSTQVTSEHSPLSKLQSMSNEILNMIEASSANTSNSLNRIDDENVLAKNSNDDNTQLILSVSPNMSAESDLHLDKSTSTSTIDKQFEQLRQMQVELKNESQTSTATTDLNQVGENENFKDIMDIIENENGTRKPSQEENANHNQSTAVQPPPKQPNLDTISTASTISSRSDSFCNDDCKDPLVKKISDS